MLKMQFKTLRARGSKFLSKLLKRGMIVGTIDRYHLSHKLLSAAILFVWRRLLNPKSRHKAIEMAEEIIPKDVRKLGYEMCRDSIGGAWSEVTEGEFQITHLRYVHVHITRCDLATYQPHVTSLSQIISGTDKDSCVNSARK